MAELDHAVPAMAVQITTEAAGRYTPGEQRALVTALRPRMVSVALREITSEPDPHLTHTFFHDCAETGIEVQHILYTADEVDHLGRLLADGRIPQVGLQILHVLGRYTKGLASSPVDLAAPLARQGALALAPIGWSAP